jgi:hypothetical protein
MSDSRPAGTRRGQARPQRLLGHPRQLEHVVAARADRDADRGVAVPAVQDRAAVDRQQLALLQHPVGRRDAVDDLRPGRGADRAGEAVVAQEGRHRALVADALLGQRVERARGHARPGRGDQLLERARDDQARRHA